MQEYARCDCASGLGSFGIRIGSGTEAARQRVPTELLAECAIVVGETFWLPVGNKGICSLYNPYITDSLIHS